MSPPLARLLPDHTKLLIATFTTPLTSSPIPPLFTYPYTISSLLNYPHSLLSSHAFPPLSPHPSLLSHHLFPHPYPLLFPNLTSSLTHLLSSPLPSPHLSSPLPFPHPFPLLTPSLLSHHLFPLPSPLLFPSLTHSLPSPISSPHHSPWCCKVVYPRVFKLRYDNLCLCGCRAVGYPDVTTVPLHYYRSKCFPYTSSPSLLPSGRQSVRN